MASIPSFLMFGQEVEDRARAHALAVWPREACALVANGDYVPVDNIAEDPERDFAFDKALLLTPGLQAIIHSHPSGDYSPTQMDMEQQVATALPWGIVACNTGNTTPIFWWGHGVPVPPLERRPYRFGPSGSDGRGDCYAIIRDWYKQERDVTLREVPRDKHGFSKKTTWYDSLFEEYGWTEIKPAEMLPGDVMLVKSRSGISMHALLYLKSNGLCLHHEGNCLSGTTPIGVWLGYRTKCIRYDQVSR